MDKEISRQEINRRRNKIWLYAGLSVVVLALASWLLRGALGNSVKRSDIRVAVVETGDIENTLSASGEVLPEFEQVITSPIGAILQQVYVNTGATVKVGDKILELDKTLTQMEFDRQKDELELKRNGIVKIKLDLDKSFYDIKIQDSIKACRINSLKADLENAKRLFKAGGGTRESIEQAETNLQIAQLEKRQLENDIRSRQAVMRASMRESEITAAIQEKALEEMAHKLRQSDITASRAGVITFVNTNLGARVGEGEIIARIADLGSFKILGAISDNYAGQLQAGLPIVARIGDQMVRGMLLGVRPAVTNNVVNFDVGLQDTKANSLLRPKMRVELYVVTDARQKTVRVANGPAFRGAKVQDVFVLRPDGKSAERRTVKIGLTSFDYVEIEEGLQPGETIILSDLTEYRNAKAITVK